jgi:hypothetical protein
VIYNLWLSYQNIIILTPENSSLHATKRQLILMGQFTPKMVGQPRRFFHSLVFRAIGWDDPVHAGHSNQPQNRPIFNKKSRSTYCFKLVCISESHPNRSKLEFLTGLIKPV